MPLRLTWDHWQNQARPMLASYMDIVPSLQPALHPILWVIVLKDARSLSVVAGDLQNQFTASTNNHVRRPDLHVECVDLISFDRLHVRGEVAAVW